MIFFAKIGVKLDNLLPHGTKEYGDFLGIQPKCRFKFTKVSVRDVNYLISKMKYNTSPGCGHFPVKNVLSI